MRCHLKQSIETIKHLKQTIKTMLTNYASKKTLHYSKTEPQLNVDNQSLLLYFFNA